MVGQPLPGNRNDCKAWEESCAKAAVGRTLTIADGGYPGTGLVMPHRRRKSEDLPDWKKAHNKSHKQVRARVEHVFARLKTWKVLRDCRLKGDGVHLAMLGIARMHNLTLAGKTSRPHNGQRLLSSSEVIYGTALKGIWQSSRCPMPSKVGAPAALDGHLRPKARVMVWVMPPPLRCLAVIRMDT